MSAPPGPVAALLDLLLPTPCAGCGAPATRWCAACDGRFARPRRHAVAGLPPVVVLTSYAGPARRALLAYKERGRRDLARPLGAAVHAALGLAVPGPWCLVPAPSTAAAARARGGDHMLRLARGVRGAHARAAPGPGEGGGAPAVVAALRLRRGAADSVGLDAGARAANLRRHLRVRPAGAAGARRAADADGRAVVLLDDVLTTGATARAAVALLAAAGVRVDAVAVLTAVPGGPAGAGVALRGRRPADPIGSPVCAGPSPGTSALTNVSVLTPLRRPTGGAKAPEPRVARLRRTPTPATARRTHPPSGR